MIAGAPASGKGTQCELIVDKYGLEHISAGDLLRAAVAAGTDLGMRAKEFMDRGDLVPDEVVVGMVVEALDTDKAKSAGWLLDGYPRSASQADAITKEGIVPDAVVLLDVPDDILVERVVGRRMDPETGKIYHLKFNPPSADVAERCTQRSDDTEEKAMNRLKVHHSNVEAVVGKYEGKIKEIDGNRSKADVFADICGVIDERCAMSNRVRLMRITGNCGHAETKCSYESWESGRLTRLLFPLTCTHGNNCLVQTLGVTSTPHGLGHRCTSAASLFNDHVQRPRLPSRRRRRRPRE